MQRPAVSAAVIVLAALVLASCSAPGRKDRHPLSGAGSGNVDLLFAGDVMLGRGVAPVARSDPWGVFGDVQAQVRAADVAIANLESPLTSRPPESPGPNALEADPATARLLASAGFDAMSMANNHSGDAGPGGVEDTLAALEAAGIRPLGGGVDAKAASSPRILIRGGLRIGLLAFDATQQGLRAGPASPGVTWWEARAAREAVQRLRPQVDLLIVGLHGGAEYSFRPDAFIGGLGQLLARWGADVVWASGSHVAQPVRAIDPDGDGRATVIATSLGNLVFDQTQPGTTTGAFLEVLADASGALAYRVGRTDGGDYRAHFDRWQPPSGDAVAFDGSWWALLRDVRPAPTRAPGRLPSFPATRWRVLASTVGDANGDGRAEVVVSYLSPFHPTLVNTTLPARRWVDRRGFAAHVGLWRRADLRPIWIAGTVLRPVTALAACAGGLVVAYSRLNDPATIATGLWLWRGYGFASSVDLPGPGRPACADVNGDGRLDPVILDRTQPAALEWRST
ncbi:MAG: CapA family protein [Actinobacteria bacterium]|nr:CapA family protein [Actinomycetota bacterium]